jgi:hypothetical protein
MTNATAQDHEEEGAAGTGTYPVTLTAAQVFGFADLVRRLNASYSQDGEASLRQELCDALFGHLNLLPEPSDADGDAYLAAVRAGQLPNWNMDPLPLTETTAEWAARTRPGYAAKPKAA